MSVNGAMNKAATIENIKDVIYSSCLYQDDQQWNDWLDLCADDFQYAIKSYSPEIQADMTYFSGDRAHLKTMTEMLPKHNTDQSPLKRHCTVYKVEVDDDGKSASAISSFVVYQTLLDGINSHVDSGESRLFLIGVYKDRFSIDGDQVKFTERETRLENRRLDKGSHWPI